MSADARLEYLDVLIKTVENAWPRVAIEIQERIDHQVGSLICSENPEARGAIKALQNLLELPDLLKQERASINAELSERDSAI